MLQNWYFMYYNNMVYVYFSSKNINIIIDIYNYAMVLYNHKINVWRR
jgi:hypothetical protein